MGGLDGGAEARVDARAKAEQKEQEKQAPVEGVVEREAVKAESQEARDEVKAEVEETVATTDAKKADDEIPFAPVSAEEMLENEPQPVAEPAEAVDATTLDALQQDWDTNIKPKIVETLAKYNTDQGVAISFDATSDVETLPNGARIVTLHLGDKTIDIRFKAPRDGKGYDSRMIYVGTGVSYGDVKSAVIAKADMLMKRAEKKIKKVGPEKAPETADDDGLADYEGSTGASYEGE